MIAIVGCFRGMEIFAPLFLAVREIFARSLVSLGARNSWKPVGEGAPVAFWKRDDHRGGPGLAEAGGTDAGCPEARDPEGGFAASPDPGRLGSPIADPELRIQNCGSRIADPEFADPELRILNLRILNLQILRSRVTARSGDSAQPSRPFARRAS